MTAHTKTIVSREAELPKQTGLSNDSHWLLKENSSCDQSLSFFSVLEIACHTFTSKSNLVQLGPGSRQNQSGPNVHQW